MNLALKAYLREQNVFKKIILVMVIATASVGIVVGFLAGRGEINSESEKEQPIKVGPRIVQSADGKILVALDTQTRDLAGIKTSPLASSGTSGRGVSIPRSAILRFDGKAWVYIEQSSNQFSLREVPFESSNSSGWLVTSGFNPGDLVVVVGAQVLLSEEQKSLIQTSRA